MIVIKHGTLGIQEPLFSADSAYKTSKAASGELVDSLLGGSALNYIGHRKCACGAIAGERKDINQMELAELARRKELAGRQERNRLHMATRNGAWLSAVTNRLNSMEFSQEELQDNIRIRYGLMPQDIHATYDG